MSCSTSSAKEFSSRTAPSWTPAREYVDQVESKLSLPEETEDLEGFFRFYSGFYRDDAKIFKGVFVSARLNSSFAESRGLDPNGDKVHIYSSVRELPVIADGGCHVVEFWWNASLDKLEFIQCHGRA